MSTLHFDLGRNPNSLSRLLPVVSLVEEGHLHFDRFKDLTMDKGQIGDHFYSDKAPFTSFFVLPFYWIAQKIFHFQSLEVPHPSVFILGNILCGLLPFLLWLFLLKKDADRSVSKISLIIGYAFASFPVIYVGTVFGHLWAGVFLLLSWRAARRKQVMTSGVWAGLCFLTEYPMAVLWPFLLLKNSEEKRNRSLLLKNTVLFSVGLLPFVLLALFYNYILSGNALKMPYAFVNDPAFAHAQSNYGFRLPSPKAVWGLLFGFKRGAFFYAPVLFYLFYLSFKKKVWSHIVKDLSRGSGLLFLLTTFFILFLSSYGMWWGGWSYGPRHLIPLYVLLGYEILPWLQVQSYSQKIWIFFTVLGLASLALALLTVGFMIPDHFLYPWLNPFIKHILEARWNSENLWLRLLGS